MPEQDKYKILYDAVSTDYDIGTFDEFKTKLNNPESRKAFYNGVGAEYELGTFDEFNQKLSPTVIQPTGQPGVKKKVTQSGFSGGDFLSKNNLNAAPNFLPEGAQELESFSQGFIKPVEKPTEKPKSTFFDNKKFGNSLNTPQSLDKLLDASGFSPDVKQIAEGAPRKGTAPEYKTPLSRVVDDFFKTETVPVVNPDAGIIIDDAITKAQRKDAAAEINTDEGLSNQWQIHRAGGGELSLQEYKAYRLEEISQSDPNLNNIYFNIEPTVFDGTSDIDNLTQSFTSSLSKTSGKDINDINRVISGYTASYLSDIKKKDYENFKSLTVLMGNLGDDGIYRTVDKTLKESGKISPAQVGAFTAIGLGIKQKMSRDISMLSGRISKLQSENPLTPTQIEMLNALKVDISNYEKIVNAANQEGAAPEIRQQAINIKGDYERAIWEHNKLVTMDNGQSDKINEYYNTIRKIQDNYIQVDDYFKKFNDEKQAITNRAGELNTHTGIIDGISDFAEGVHNKLILGTVSGMATTVARLPFIAGKMLGIPGAYDALLLNDLSIKHSDLSFASPAGFNNSIGFRKFSDLKNEVGLIDDDLKTSLIKHNPNVNFDNLMDSDFVRVETEGINYFNLATHGTAEFLKMITIYSGGATALSRATGLGMPSATVIATQLSSYNDYYAQALNTELSPDERWQFALAMSTFEGLTNTIMPDYKLFLPASNSIKSLVTEFKRGGTKTLTKALLSTAEKVIKENLEEDAMVVIEKINQVLVNHAKGKKIFAEVDVMAGFEDAALLTAVTMGLAESQHLSGTLAEMRDSDNIDGMRIVELAKDKNFSNLEKTLIELVEGGKITQEKSDLIKKSVDGVRSIKNKLPDSLRDNYKAIVLLGERDELISKLMPVDKADSKTTFFDKNKETSEKIQAVEKQLKQLAAMSQYESEHVKDITYAESISPTTGKKVYIKTQDGTETVMSRKNYLAELKKLRSFGSKITNKGGTVLVEDVKGKLHIYNEKTTEGFTNWYNSYKAEKAKAAEDNKSTDGKAIPFNRRSYAEKQSFIADFVNRINPHIREMGKSILANLDRELSSGKISKASIDMVGNALVTGGKLGTARAVSYDEKRQVFVGLNEKGLPTGIEIPLSIIKGNTEWINPLSFTEDTLIHEVAAHPYVSSLVEEAGYSDKRNIDFTKDPDTALQELLDAPNETLNPQAQVLKKGFQLIRGTKYHTAVQNSVYNGEFEILEEALVTAIGDYGAQLVGKEKTKFQEFLDDVLKWLNNTLFKNRGITAKEFETMSLKKYLEGIGADLFQQGENVVSTKKTGKFSLKTVTNNLGKIFDNNPAEFERLKTKAVFAYEQQQTQKNSFNKPVMEGRSIAEAAEIYSGVLNFTRGFREGNTAENQQRLREYAKENDIYLSSSEQFQHGTPEVGEESAVFLQEDGKSVVKLTIPNPNLEITWYDLFDNHLAQGLLFPHLSYSFIGFTERTGGKLAAVFSQRAVPVNESTPEQIEKWGLANGFDWLKEVLDNPRLGVMLTDLHSKNVLVDGNLLNFIDPMIVITDPKKFYVSVIADVYKDNEAEGLTDIVNLVDNTSDAVTENREGGELFPYNTTTDGAKFSIIKLNNNIPELNIKRKYTGIYNAEDNNYFIKLSNPYKANGMGTNRWELTIESKLDNTEIYRDWFESRKEASQFGAEWILDPNNIVDRSTEGNTPQETVMTPEQRQTTMVAKGEVVAKNITNLFAELGKINPKFQIGDVSAQPIDDGLDRNQLRKIYKKSFGETITDTILRELTISSFYSPEAVIDFLKKTIPIKKHMVHLITKMSGDIDNMFIDSVGGQKIELQKSSESAIDLLTKVGYSLNRVIDIKDARKVYRGFYKGGEVICTLKTGDRTADSIVTFIVRDDAEITPHAKDLTRKNLTPRWKEYLKQKGLQNKDGSFNLKRITQQIDDPYSTSILSLQIAKEGKTLKSISRYNHSVSPADYVYRDLDKLISGLHVAFYDYFDVSLPSYDSAPIYVDPSIFLSGDGRLFHRLGEINGEIWGDGFLVKNNGAVSIFDPSHARVFDGVVVDTFNNRDLEKNKHTIAGYDIGGQTKGFIILSAKFINSTDISIVVNQPFNGKHSRFTANLKVENGRIVKFHSDDLISAGESFLYNSVALAELSIPNLTTVGNYFLGSNNKIKEISAPKLRTIGSHFLKSNYFLQKLSLPSVEEIGDNFNYTNFVLTELSLPKLRVIGSNFFMNNMLMDKISLPSIQKIGSGFLSRNKNYRINLFKIKHSIKNVLGLNNTSTPTQPNTSDATTTNNTKFSIVNEIKNKAISEGVFMKAPNGKPTKLSERQWLQTRTPEFKSWFGDWESDPENASKVVDENGEPLVVYHGSASQDIDEFDRSKAQRQKSGLAEFADFFTSSADVAKIYSDHPKSKAYIDGVNKKISELEKLRDTTRNNRDWDRISSDINNLKSLIEQGRVYEVFLNIKSPLTFDGDGLDTRGWDNLSLDLGYKTASGRALVLEALSGNNSAYTNDKYDGVIGTNIADMSIATTNKDYVKSKTDKIKGSVYATLSPNQIKSATENNGSFGDNPNIKFSIVDPSGKNIDVKSINADVVNGFYSPLEKALNETKFEKLPAKQWIGKVIKGDEAKWTGVTDWLNKQEGSVSKTDIQNFLRDNRVEIVEKVRTWENDALFSEHRLDGNYENYREILVILPNTENRNLNFVKSHHFPNPNILVHLRINNRVDTEGNNVLLLEEIQSDWGQDGKKEGFKHVPFSWDSPLANDVLAALKDMDLLRFDTLGEAVRTISNISNEGFSGFDILPEYKDLFSQFREAIRQSKMIQTAPFVTDTNSWTKLGLKVALKEAVKQGVDKIAWTTGEQQNKRWNQTHVADLITYSKKGDKYIVIPYDGERAIKRQELTEAELRKSFPDDIVEKIINDKGTADELSGLKALTDISVPIGGKGMKGFYGSPTEGNLGIVGNIAKKLTNQDPKKIDIAVRTTSSYPINLKVRKKGNEWEAYIPGGFLNLQKEVVDGFDTKEEAERFVKDPYGLNDQVYSIDITPELAASVSQGQPLFQIVGQKAQLTSEIRDHLDLATKLERDLNLGQGYWDNPTPGELSDMKKIRTSTGWERAKDGYWRYEISDVEISDKYQDIDDIPMGTVSTLNLFLGTAPLLQQYPELKKFKVIRTEDESSYQEGTDYFKVDATSIEEFRTTLVHEMQHYVQFKEGFARGGNEDSLKDKYISDYNTARDIYENDPSESNAEKLQRFETEYPDGVTERQARDYYIRLSGEVEARNAEWRLNLTPAERIERMLYETEQSPRDKQVQKFPAGNRMLPQRVGVDISRRMIEGDKSFTESYNELLDEAHETVGFTPTFRALQSIEDDVKSEMITPSTQTKPVVKFSIDSQLNDDVSNRISTQLEKEGYIIDHLSRLGVDRPTGVLRPPMFADGSETYSEFLLPLLKSRKEVVSFLGRAGVEMEVPFDTKFQISPSLPHDEIKDVIAKGLEDMFSPELIRNEIINLYGIKTKAGVAELDSLFETVYNNSQGKGLDLKKRRTALKSINAPTNDVTEFYVAETLDDIISRHKAMDPVDQEILRAKFDDSTGAIGVMILRILEKEARDEKVGDQEYEDLWNKVRELGTEAGKKLNMFKLLKKNSVEDKLVRLDKMAKQTNRTLPPPIKDRFRKLFTDQKKLKTDISVNTGVLPIQDIADMMIDLGKVNMEIEILSRKFNPAMIRATSLFSNLKGNLFTPATLIANAVINTHNAATKAIIMSPLTAAMSYTNGTSYITFRDAITGIRRSAPITWNNIKSSYSRGSYESASGEKVGDIGSESFLRYFNPLVEDIGAIYDKMFTNRTDEEIASNRNFLLKDEKISKGDMVMKFVAGSAGANSDLMLRSLVTGDVPFSNASYFQHLRRLGRREGLSGEALSKFIDNPPSHAHDLAVQESRVAIYTQKNMFSSAVSETKNWMKKKSVRSAGSGGRLAAKAGYIGSELVMPFSHVPLNFVGHILKIANPTLYLADLAPAMFEVYDINKKLTKERGRERINEDKISNLLKRKKGIRDRVYKSFYSLVAGHTVLGFFKIIAASGAFFTSGDDDKRKDIKKNNRNRDVVNKLNVHLLIRWFNRDQNKIWVPVDEEGDLVIDINRLSTISLLPTILANKAEREKFEERSMGIVRDELYDMTSTMTDLLSVAGNLKETVGVSLQQTFIQTIAKITEAASKTEPTKMSALIVDLLNTAITYTMVPNNVVVLQKASRDYIPSSNRKIGAENGLNLVGRVENLMKTKFNIKGSTIKDDFGRDVKQTPEGYVFGDSFMARVIYHGFDIMRPIRIGDKSGAEEGEKVYTALDNYLTNSTGRGLFTEKFPSEIKDHSGRKQKLTVPQIDQYSEEMGALRLALVNKMFVAPALKGILLLNHPNTKHDAIRLEELNNIDGRLYTYEQEEKNNLIDKLADLKKVDVMNNDGTFNYDLDKLFNKGTIDGEVYNTVAQKITREALLKPFNDVLSEIVTIYNDHFLYNVMDIKDEIPDVLVDKPAEQAHRTPEVKGTLGKSIEDIKKQLNVTF
jgi:hypothetical protein